MFLPDWQQRFLRGECKIVRKSRRTRALLLHFDLSSDSQNLSPAVVILPPLATAIYRCCFEQEHRHPGKEIPRQMSHHSHTEMLIRHCHVWHYWTNEIAAAVTKGLSLLELNFDWLLTSSPIWPEIKIMRNDFFKKESMDFNFVISLYGYNTFNDITNA